MKEQKKSNKIILGIIAIVIGGGALIASVAFFIIDLISTPDLRDAEFLVQKGTWVMQSNTASKPTDCVTTEEGGEPTDCITTTSEAPAENVIWKFTEIGKGTLTTNNHIDDHDFKWALDGNKLLIETEWLYTLYNEVTYSLDQKEETLILTDENGHKATFKPAQEEKSDAEPTEAQSIETQTIEEVTE